MRDSSRRSPPAPTLCSGGIPNARSSRSIRLLRKISLPFPAVSLRCLRSGLYVSNHSRCRRGKKVGLSSKALCCRKRSRSKRWISLTSVLARIEAVFLFQEGYDGATRVQRRNCGSFLRPWRFMRLVDAVHWRIMQKAAQRLLSSSNKCRKSDEFFPPEAAILPLFLSLFLLGVILYLLGWVTKADARIWAKTRRPLSYLNCGPHLDGL